MNSPENQERTVIYTDGACLGNPGPGGWAWVVEGGGSDCGGEENTTNQRMELRAALEAMLSLEGALHILSDSKYLVQCFEDSWWVKWQKNGWKNANKKPVKNRDLWEPIIAEHQKRDVVISWVKGHSGVEGNEAADMLAVAAAEQIKNAHG